MRNYIFLGPPGAGKGTMSAMLAERDGNVHISTGDILRSEIKNGTELGRQAQSFIQAGQLVPDEVVAAIVSQVLNTTEVRERGFILDGYPRTVAQAQLLDAALADASLELDQVVLFQVDRELLIRRLTGRRICRECGAVYHVLFTPPKETGVCDKCGGALYQRPDDGLDTVQERLHVYHEQTEPLISFYQERGLLLPVPAHEEKHASFATLCERLRR